MTKNGNYSRSEIELKCESALNKLTVSATPKTMPVFLPREVTPLASL